MSDKNDRPNAVRIDSFGFEIDQPRRGFSMLGLFLIVFGLLLAAGSLFQAAQLGANALFLALGLVLLLVWLRDHSETALVLGLIVTALAMSDLLTGIGVLKGDGWGTTFLGIGALLLAFIRARTGKSWAWAVILGGLLLLWGGSEVVATYSSVSLGRVVGPLLLVLIGLWLITRRHDFGG
jgi:hypothetical protein